MKFVRLLFMIDLKSGRRLENRISVNPFHPWLQLKENQIVDYECGAIKGEAKVLTYPYREELRCDNKTTKIVWLKAIS
jgi:hypothetical protein